jgi:hypothetical protein
MPLPVPRCYKIFKPSRSGFGLKGHAFASVALPYLDAGQHATFEIQRPAQIGKILIPTGIEVPTLPAADRGLRRR